MVEVVEAKEEIETVVGREEVVERMVVVEAAVV